MVRIHWELRINWAVHSLDTPPIANPGGGGTHGIAIAKAHAKAHRLDVFGLGLDYAMYHKVLWDGIPPQTQQWERLGGIFMSAPSAVAWNDSHTDGRVDVFGLGLDRAMYHKTWNTSTWTPDWERLGGIFTSEASVVYNS